MPTPRPPRSFPAAAAHPQGVPFALAPGLAALCALFACAAAAGPASRASPTPTPTPAPEAQAPPAARVRVPVLVELFTSEGCSSCPPADAVLARLVRTQPIDGVEIVGLSEHVDYWNSATFRDPYSSRLFTDRQEGYAPVFGQNRLYTPQAVVGGKREALGSDDGAVRRAAAAAAREPSGRASLRARASREGVEVHLEVASLPEHGRSEIWVGLVEDDLSSVVESGENGGRTLQHAAVVRVLRSAGQVEGAQASAGLRLHVDPAWKRGSLRAIAFVQEQESRRILASARAPVAPGEGGLEAVRR